MKTHYDTSMFALFIILLAQQCNAGGRHFIKTELRNNPVRAGLFGALNENSHYSSWKRRNSKRSITPVSLCNDENEDSSSRFASVVGSEQEALGIAVTPYLKPRSSSRPSKTKYLEDEIITCSSMQVDPYHPEGDESRALLVANSRGSSRSRRGTMGTKKTVETSDTRGGNVVVAAMRPLLFWESMVSGAVSRSIAQTVMHPANTMKTILQSSRGADRPTLGQLMKPAMFKTLTRGAGANFVLSVPHGAVNFAVLEFVRSRLNNFVSTVPFLAERADSMGAGLDFLSSAISTICCSVVSTPQMMITDNIMAGNYPGLNSAVSGLYSDRGVLGFYSGWWPGLVGKIPSYALTWTFFQQLKRIRNNIFDEPAKNIENTIMGCMASTTTVCIMIPLDTIKTRLVTQLSSKATNAVPYKGIIDCAIRITREEGIKTFYRGLAPRLMSVVPMIGIQFGVYEAMKKVMIKHNVPKAQASPKKKVQEVDRYGNEESLEETAMEVAASASSPFPAPHLLKQKLKKTKRDLASLGKRVIAKA